MRLAMYQLGFLITWVIAFLSGYIHAISEYGFFLGAGLGWFPAAIVATIVASLWPLVAIAIIIGVVATFLRLGKRAAYRKAA